MLGLELNDPFRGRLVVWLNAEDLPVERASLGRIAIAGDVLDNPMLHICRSQTDVSVKGDCMKLAEEMKGFHWMMSYGNYMRETGYVLKRLGVDFHDVSTLKA